MTHHGLAAALCAALASATLAGGVNPDWSIARQWTEEALQAIRLATPRPPVHGRNLYHLSAAMYDGWAAYDPTARGVFVLEKHEADDPPAARHETMSFAAYRLLKARFVAGNGANIAQIQASLDALFAELGYDAAFTSTVGSSPAAIGNRIASVILGAGIVDGSNEALNYASVPVYQPWNESFSILLPGSPMYEPSKWQALGYGFLVLANGNIIPTQTTNFIGPHWGNVVPFALNEYDRNSTNGAFLDQGPPPQSDGEFGSDALHEQLLDLIARTGALDSSNPETMNIAPGVHHNSPLGTYGHPGHGDNPVTGEPYEPNVVLKADYYRATAEHWLDGPLSETSAGHWYVIANEVADSDGFPFQLGGEGPRLDRLEWDTKMYLALGGASHDAAVAAWSMKRAYEASRPISLVRSMGGKGQSSDPRAPSYDQHGLPLSAGIVRLLAPEDVAPGAALEDLVELVYHPLTGEPIGVDDHVGDVIVRTWLGAMPGGTIGPPTPPALAGHVYLDDAGWHAGGFELGANDTAGVLNTDLTPTSNVRLSELRVGQPGLDTDEYIEITGPPGANLTGISFLTLGDETESWVPFGGGYVQVLVDLAGHTIGDDGLFVIGDSMFSLTRPDLVHPLDFKERSNCTHALVTGFSGYLGQDLDILDNGDLYLEPWSAAIDSVAMRRSNIPAGLYLGAPIVPEQASATQRYGVDWMLADRWLPYHPMNSITPPFPGYASGHSAFGRACAETLARITGSPYFPGGLGSKEIAAGSLLIESAPSATVTLQWASYADAADEAGESRLWSGVHLMDDDIAGRIAGVGCGIRAASRAMALFEGLARSPDISGDGTVDGTDLGMLLAEWGPGGTTVSPGDLDGDGEVDGADMGLLLGAWVP